MASGCLLALAMGLLPGFEPRYAAPILAHCYGTAAAALLASAEAVLLAAVLAYLADRAWRLALILLPPDVRGRLEERIDRARRRVHGLVARYGALGLAVFVAVPLPVTGIYTGAVVAALLGIPRRYAAPALAAGGVASVAITLALYAGARAVAG
ncbi:MAG: small multi-drug export protein [Crenarchaeota archaeon]|nr:small multi-drug export protein [Thermoproteota archaeon]